MIFVLTPEQMRTADAAAVAELGEIALMRTAGERIAEVVLATLDPSTVVAFAGPGNNGGDAFAVCAALRERDAEFDCTVYGDENPTASEARRDAETRAARSGVKRRAFPRTPDELRDALDQATCVLDAIVGTGAQLPLREPFATAARAMNEAGKPVVAIDIPSGIDALTGAVSDPAVSATITVTLGALKPGLVLEPARDSTGTLYVADIGIPLDILRAQQSEFAVLDDASFATLLPTRSPDADKRASGAPLIIAGSRQFPGAAVLCAKAAARAGAGYVTVATPASAAAAVRAHLLEQVVTELGEDASVDDAVAQLLDTARHCGAIGIGPGLGLDDRTGEIIRAFLRQCDLPFVADASALFHFAKHLDILNTPRAVITPHAGEFARLSGKGTIAAGERVARLRDFVGRTHCTTLLKGRTTLVYDGTKMHLNTTGTPALATAGTGDVLTGMIATLLSQGLAPVDAARAAAYWHGLAGHYCERERPRGVVAGDLPDALANVIPLEPHDDPITFVFGA